jgi:N-(5'phosphoribosyl)anthranilate (PRA) isomerase
VELSGAKTLDVSSGVETTPGVKDPALIKALLGTARWGAETPRKRALARARSGLLSFFRDRSF